MNILFFGKKRHGSGIHEYQRTVIKSLPVNGVKLYGIAVMMNDRHYDFDRFDCVGNAVFVDQQWDEGDNDMINAIGREATILALCGPSSGSEYLEIDRMSDYGCPCHKE